MLNNKRGDIPIIILVLGVVTICMLAIFSFIIDNRNVKDRADPLGIGTMEKLNSDVEKFYFYLEVEGSPEKAATRIDGASIEDGKLVIVRDSEVVSIVYEENLNEKPDESSKEK